MTPSDDMVRRLRETSDEAHYADCTEAADRIEQLEAQLGQANLECQHHKEYAQECHAKMRPAELHDRVKAGEQWKIAAEAQLAARAEPVATVKVWDRAGQKVVTFDINPVQLDALRANPDASLYLAPPDRAEPQPVAFSFLAHIQRAMEFSLRTFGPGHRSKGVVDHIRKELLEIEAAPLDLEEWVDVWMLALDGAWRTGATPQQIIDQILAKQTKNEGRKWPDWRTADRDKGIEHDRSVDPAPPAYALGGEPTDADIDRALRACIPGGSYARDWFLPHEHPKGRENVHDVVRRMLQTYSKSSYALGFQEAREAAAKACLEPAEGLVYKRYKTLNECAKAIRALEKP